MRIFQGWLRGGGDNGMIICFYFFRGFCVTPTLGVYVIPVLNHCSTGTSPFGETTTIFFFRQLSANSNSNKLIGRFGNLRRRSDLTPPRLGRKSRRLPEANRTGDLVNGNAYVIRSAAVIRRHICTKLK